MNGDEARRIYDKLDAMARDIGQIAVEVGEIGVEVRGVKKDSDDHEARLRVVEGALSTTGKIAVGGAAAGGGGILLLLGQRLLELVTGQ